MYMYITTTYETKKHKKAYRKSKNERHEYKHYQIEQ